MSVDKEMYNKNVKAIVQGLEALNVKMDIQASQIKALTAEVSKVSAENQSIKVLLARAIGSGTT